MAEKTPDNAVVISFRCDEALAKALVARASAQRRSTSSYIINTLADALDLSYIQENILDQLKDAAVDKIVNCIKTGGDHPQFGIHGRVQSEVTVQITPEIRARADAKLKLLSPPTGKTRK